MEIFRYSGDEFDLYGDGVHEATSGEPGYWRAPIAEVPLDADIEVPGSKSLTNRELVLSAIAHEPTTLHAPLHARDTILMAQALEELGTGVERVASTHNAADDLVITPAEELSGGVSIDCGLAGTVMRFVPPLAGLALGPVTFDGDEGARRRPMAATLEALRGLGIKVSGDSGGRLPFSVQGIGRIAGGELEIDASASSQFVSGLLLVAPRFEQGLTLTHTGESLPSLPHINMTLDVLKGRGVTADAVDARTWRVEPGEIGGGELTVEPDLSNAAPFLIASIIAGGTVRIPNWPESTAQVGDLLREILPRFGAQITLEDGLLTCTVEQGIVAGARPAGVDLDLSVGGELAPNIAGLLALCEGESVIRGVGHLRGHETDRLAALATELGRVGADVEETDDGLIIRPAPLHGALWQCYADHRMATTGALIGLAVDEVQLDDVECTTKTLPDFPGMWRTLLGERDEADAPISLDSLLDL
ncbi:3-phosphoshikimate 1-carboxyvinyltransferase [Gulosibacter sp. ACHW.36C]|uniref:3-phosphoshikimate 1-carboxyvinyltransferase n=1 Tax=Gulosibacter sediminis TaxID=1729695 RepID=A0ABY4N3S9_9MICO|nr:3-phosphoshikimate 1-carboxyvinyltransferase [Gulosibacter sediminis]UQN15883.1 3-phosphoshikimate 1-carboxyvinyltransferase [Gulosibacter sediminis]